ncbi:hypothetical protein [Hymenobacter canadensis]|uniref:Lipoprotein n=1 Tax=Hymenobacter canadensis TaxID=2999067 RepID=A0ABY7LV30_9BACT|nr:hypothetical protein [Hymenobacter canadensis]WBA44248.1 hypothetical protein O3303_21470 [Hymenobacter canadensis]
MIRTSTIAQLTLLLLSNLLIACKPDLGSAKGNFGQHPQLHLQQHRFSASSQRLLNQFAEAHTLADSVVKLAIPDKRHWQYLITDYGLSYPYWEAHPTDTLPGPALEYKFYYGLLYRGDTIRSAIVSISPNMRVNTTELAELVAYNHFLMGNLEIGPKQAFAIASAYGVKEKEASITFHGNSFYSDQFFTLQQVKATYHAMGEVAPASFYWDIQSTCDGCASLKVNAANGKAFAVGKTVFIY